MKTSFMYDFVRLSDTAYRAELHGTAGGLRFSYRLGPPGKFEVWLRSSCCDLVFRNSRNRGPYDKFTTFFCPKCGTTSPYETTVCERVFWATKWFETALDHHVDPFNAPIMAHDLGLMTRRVFQRWSGLQGHSDRYDEDLTGLRAEESLKTLVLEFGGVEVGV